MRGKYVPWSPETAAEVIRRLRAGEPVSRICKDPKMPSAGSLRLWARTRPAFGAEMEAARDPAHRKAAGGFRRAGPGRPAGYTAELARAVCDRLAEGCSMRQLRRQMDLPSPTTLFEWMTDHPQFRRMYLAACEARALTLRDEALEIADDRGEELARAKLRADLRMRQAAACQPRSPDKARPEPPEPTYEDMLRELLKLRAARRGGSG